MSVRVEAVDRVPDPEALSGLMRDYYGWVRDTIRGLGGPDLDPDAMVADMWDDIDRFLPPRGALILARDAEARLVGSGFLHEIAPGVGEMKRLFVRPEAQGTGLGRRLIEARIEAARERGFRAVCADTAQGNTPMLRLYERLGFRAVDRYPGHRNYDAVLPLLVYRWKDL